MEVKTLCDDILAADFSDARTVTDLAERLLYTANTARMFMAPDKTTADAPTVRRAAMQWVRSVESHICHMTPGDALTVTCSFDIIHRIAYSRPACDSFLDTGILRAFDAFIHGDTTVDEHALFRAVSDSINRRHAPAFLGKPLRWYAHTIPTKLSNLKWP